MLCGTSPPLSYLLSRFSHKNKSTFMLLSRKKLLSCISDHITGMHYACRDDGQLNFIQTTTLWAKRIFL
jgi:hypothetical protein